MNTLAHLTNPERRCAQCQQFIEVSLNNLYPSQHIECEDFEELHLEDEYITWFA